MALYWSTGLRQFIAQHGSYKRALQGGCMIIFSGTVPSNADDAAASGTAQLALITLSSGSYTAETQASASITLGGSGGSVDTFTVGKSGETAVEIMGAAVPWNTSGLTQTATDVVNQIQKYLSNPEYEVSSSGAVITVKSLLGTGTAQNNFVVTVTASGGLTEDAPKSLTGGVATVNGLTYLYGVSGVLAATGTWSGVVSNSGTASYWRIYGPNANEWGVPSSGTDLIRVQGTCGTSSSYNYVMASTTLTAATTHTVSALNLTLPAS